MSLLVRVMQAWERCAGTHTPQAVIPLPPVQSSRCTVFSSHLIYHTSPVSSGIKYSSRDSPRISHSSRTALTCTQSWPALARPSVTREARWYFQLPAPHPILISSLCSGPVCGRAWVSRLLPTSGHVAHGSVSSIDETRQPRVSSIAQSRLGLPSQTRVTVTHTSVPSPISMRGAAPEAFASGTERELTGSAPRGASPNRSKCLGGSSS
jgi:hypothetical protein